MDSSSCTHKDLRQVDNLRCCMSCGETLYLRAQPHISPELNAPFSSKEDDTSQGLSHTYGDLRLTTGHAIRVVVLLPGDLHDPIICTIATVDLDKAHYDAVSYTWATEDGDDRKTGRIHLPDGVLPVTENCEAILRQLRLRPALRQLWIDAICIDQSNTRERNHQVEQMDRIYRSAATVHICISDPGRRYTECMRWLNFGAGLMFWPKTALSLTTITQLNNLFQRRYFSRVWVIQELHLARDIVLHVNSDEVPHFKGVLKRLCKFLDVPHVLRDIQDVPRKRSIMNCMRMSLSASSSDPRDKVFAILSLLDPDIRKYIPVNYSLEYSQILGAAVMLSISESGNLRLLRFVRLPATSNSITACSFGMSEFLNFLQSTHRDPDLDPDSILEFVYPKRTKIVVVKMASEESQHGDHMEYFFPVASEDDCTMIEQTSQWYPAQQILPRIKVWAHMIDIFLGPLKSGNISVADLLTHQAGGDSAEYVWIKNFLQDSRDEFPRTSEQHKLPSYVDWEDLDKCISEMGKFTKEDVTVPTSGTKHTSETIRSETQHISGSLLFRSHYSIGCSSSLPVAGDLIGAIVGVSGHFLLRPIADDTYRIVGTCYLWVAKALEHWRPGTREAWWERRPKQLSRTYRTIEIY